ncbi:MAG: hypothetical protein ABEI39_01920 [Halobacteriales archaeon]
MSPRPGRRAVLAAAATALAGCRGEGGRVTTDRGPLAAPEGRSVGYTHHRPDGNRLVEGTGSLPAADPVDTGLGFEPAWLVAAPLQSGSLWVAVGPEGRVRGLRAGEDGVEGVAVTPDRLPPGVPPLLVVEGGDARLLASPLDDPAPATHPVPLGDGRLAALSAGGDLVLHDGGVRDRLPVDAPPDARILVDGDRLVVLSDATDRYTHGALGDRIEAGGVAVVGVGDGLSLRTRIRTPGEAVIEGIAPILAGLGAGTGIVVTETDADRGAREVVYGVDGGRLAAGPAIGTGFRWRHQVAVAPFAGGEPELAAVRTPHIGGVAEFYRRRGDRLGIVATAAGYASHAYESRNLDGGLAGDFDGDGRLELLVPDTERTRLVGLRREGGTVSAAWERPVGGRMAGNLAAASHGDGVAVGVGRADGTVRLWR